MAEYKIIGYKLMPKTVLKITGNVRRLLKGISVADDDSEKNAFINSFGKIIVLFDQLIVDDNDSLYLVINEQFETRLIEHLYKYLKLNKSRMEKTELKVIHVIPMIHKIESELSELNLEGFKIKQRIGFLLLTKKASSNFDFIPSDISQIPELNNEEYNSVRIENNISEQGIDFDQEMILNTNWNEIVSYTKGCYLGQEVMARVKNLSKPPKKMIRVLFEKLPEKSIITSDNKIVGKITSCCYSQKHSKYLALCIIKNEDVKIDGGEIII